MRIDIKKLVSLLLGLCGNFNGDPDDDFKDRNSGKIIINPNEFGIQFQTNTKQK